MTTNAIPAPVMHVTARAMRDAQDWADDTTRAGHQRPGALAVAADLVDRLNAEGYVVVRAEGIQALWNENEHLKERIAWWQRETARVHAGDPCGCGVVLVRAGHRVLTGDGTTHRPAPFPCYVTTTGERLP